MISPFRWFGGKGKFTKTLLENLPSGEVYVEPFCGAATFFFAKPSHPVEVLNDLHSEIVNLFRVFQKKDHYEELVHRLTWTPYAREEFVKALDMRKQENLSDVDKAWAFFVRQNQGFGGKANTRGDWGRTFTSLRGMSKQTSDWITKLSLFEEWRNRLIRCQIDQIDALTCIQYWDSEKTVFYLDPPYIHETRTSSKDYVHEQPLSFHEDLVKILLNIKGNAMLSGYKHPVYLPLEKAGWIKKSYKTTCHAAGRIRSSELQGQGNILEKQKRTEILWIKGK